MAASPIRAHDLRIADEQAALRRVATLVADGAPPEAVFAAVAEEVGLLLEVDFAILVRYGSRDAMTIAGTWTNTGCPAPSPVGTRLQLGGRNVTTLVSETGRPARIDDAGISGAIGDVATRQWMLRSSAGVPVSVEGQLWGVMIVALTREETLPADAETRLAGFTELIATAIANAQARTELRGFAEEQAALRRVATLVARAARPGEAFAAVTAEAGRLLSSEVTVMSRYDPDGTATVVAAWTKTGETSPLPVGRRLELGGRDLHTLVFRTRQPVRIEDYAGSSGRATAIAREAGLRSGVGVPVSVEGQLWGIIGVTSRQALAADTEARLSGFTELAAAAIANAQAHEELHAFAEEQAALRRVATLVARGTLPEEVFTAVAAEAGQLLQADYTVMSRYDADGLATVIGGWARTDPGRPLAVGLCLKAEGRNMHALVLQTGRPSRIDDYGTASGALADVARDWAFRSSVGAPVSVEGRLWGVLIAGSRAEPLPTGTESRLAGFTELAGTAIANAQAQATLKASRARIVAAADAARRRIERDLHDGAQQRLVSLALQLHAAQAAAPPGETELTQRLEGAVAEAGGVLQELQEIARGLHPAVLEESGLRPALRALARRSAVPVLLDIRVAGRLPEAIEVAAYYTVAEALTNTAKHARASASEVEVALSEGVLHVRVGDDGCGGADFPGGSGLAGLRDRVEALGGRIRLHSPPGAGTSIDIALPLGGPDEPGSPPPAAG
jgi:signal transduction histidine kinase